MKLRLLAVVFVLGCAVGRLGALTLEELAADSSLWPTEVTILGNVRGSVVKDGKPAGAVLVGAGKKLTITGIAKEGITGKLGGTTVLVPADKTNLWAELVRLHPDQAGKVPVAEAPAAPVESGASSAPTPKPVPAAASAAKIVVGPTVMQRRLTGNLVRLDNNALAPVDARLLTGVKFYGLYYSASWCGPCRQFTPQFIAAYKQIKQRYPEFEVVFISADHSEGEMQAYVRDDRMPWLAVKYDAAQSSAELRRYCGPGIPCLVLVDPAGRVLSDSFEGDTYLGPGKVLDDAQRLLAAAH